MQYKTQHGKLGNVSGEWSLESEEFDFVSAGFDRRSVCDHGIWVYCEMIWFRRHPNSVEMITLLEINNR